MLGRFEKKRKSLARSLWLFSWSAFLTQCLQEAGWERFVFPNRKIGNNKTSVGGGMHWMVMMMAMSVTGNGYRVWHGKASGRTDHPVMPCLLSPHEWHYFWNLKSKRWTGRVFWIDRLFPCWDLGELSCSLAFSVWSELASFFLFFSGFSFG